MNVNEVEAMGGLVLSSGMNIGVNVGSPRRVELAGGWCRGEVGSEIRGSISNASILSCLLAGCGIWAYPNKTSRAGLAHSEPCTSPRSLLLLIVLHEFWRDHF